MATAKQIAARKRFAEMARSGKLATMRKKAAKKNPTRGASKMASVKRIYKKLRADGYTAADAKKRVLYEYAHLNESEVSSAIEAARAAYEKRLSNPAPKKKVQTKRGGCNPQYKVQIKRGGRWITVGSHGAQAAATSAAEALNASGLGVPVRVWG